MNLWNIMDRINSFLNHYNSGKYWKYKKILMSKKTGRIHRVWSLCYLKKCEAYNNASLENRLDGGSFFLSPPFFSHGIKGIFISDLAQIGANVTIY